jgi:hypothetical protein
MTSEQRALVVEIQRSFGGGCFDTTSVICEAMEDPRLASAVEAAAPNCRHRSGRFRDRAVRRILTDLAKERFTTDHYGWWCIREATP